ncbi:hypothetical protein RBG61_05600 [Paludicola sp. MB14-C6]|uniref:hypothetical protein n=1 Tax=Paludihabitans sp. MB14-C6 TaxID=3070656 RepID=UPI0027DEA043|nr:hypothetical protein [Paludicola sp. MB14-C6]WMJ24139.1 hypothetical protein RBG61_05600 [Paludicola sp. MB14-C6]
MAQFLFGVCCWTPSAILIGFAVCAFFSKKPIHFWSGTTVSEHEIKNIPAYNKANGLMWFLYGSLFFVIGVIGLIGYIALAGILLFVACAGGLPIIFYSYNKIYTKYKR